MRLQTAVSLGLALTVMVAPESAAQAAAPAAVCQGGHRDDFAAAKLDRVRWTVVRETPDLKVADGNLVIPTSNTALLYSIGHAAYSDKLPPNVVLQALPQGPFTATAKLTVEARAPYREAGLVIYGDDDNYAKLVLAAPTDNPAERIVGFTREEEGEPSQALSEALGSDFPDVVWIRFTSEGETLRAAYSADGTRFTNVLESGEDVPLRLAGSASLKIGLLAMAGTVGVPVIDAKFDWFELCPTQN